VWSMVAAKLAQARVRVWARVPTLNLPWAARAHPEWCLAPAAGSALAAAWPARLSPDLPEARRAAIDFVTDLAVYLPLDGVLFDDDAAMAADERLALSGAADAESKARAIDALVADCRDAVRAWRPACTFARNVDAAVVESDGVDRAHAQDFDRIVRDNDVAVVMAYGAAAMPPSAARRWVGALGKRAVARADAALRSARKEAVAHGAPPPAAAAGASRVLVKLPAYDWSASRWVPGESLEAWVAALRRESVANFGVYPVTPAGGDIPVRLLDGFGAQLAESTER